MKHALSVVIVGLIVFSVGCGKSQKQRQAEAQQVQREAAAALDPTGGMPKSALAGRTFVFQNAGKTVSMDLVLNADGTIGGAEHPEMSYWDIQKKTLVFLEKDKQRASHYFGEFTVAGGRYTFKGKHRRLRHEKFTLTQK